MSKSARLTVHDVGAIVRLVGECRDLGDDPSAWREHCGLRLGRLTGAALITFGEALRANGQLLPLGMSSWGWENGFDQAAVYRDLAEHGPDLSFSPIMRAYLRLPPESFGVCLSRPDLVADRDWCSSPYFRVHHDPMGFGHHLICFQTLPGGGDKVSGITLVREKAERRDFRTRDQALVQAAHDAVVQLVGGPLAGFEEPSPADLPPRVRQVLQCLLEGDGDKQVALRLGLARHTVNQYAKVIFRHFGVSSRPELLARWVRRRYGTRFPAPGATDADEVSVNTRQQLVSGAGPKIRWEDWPPE